MRPRQLDDQHCWSSDFRSRALAHSPAQYHASSFRPKVSMTTRIRRTLLIVLVGVVAVVIAFAASRTPPAATHSAASPSTMSTQAQMVVTEREVDDLKAVFATI